MIALDTNAYSKLDGASPELEQLLRTHDSIILPIIVIGEIQYGLERGSQKQPNEEKLARFLRSQRVQVVYIDDETANIYGRIFAELAKTSKPIPTNDIWIAAICLRRDSALVTNDHHFDYIPLLQTISF